MSEIGVASIIFEFIADSERTSLELPKMTSCQRKSIKKLLEQHPALLCESFGFGRERKMHLFKRLPAHDPTPAQYGLSAASLAKVSSQDNRIPTPDCSTASPSEASDESRQESTCCDDIPETNKWEVMRQSMLEQFAPRVHNTFIHIDEQTADERTTQSMPRNMFRQCLHAEAEESSKAHAYSAPSSQVHVDTARCISQVEEPPALQLGALVIVDGLTKLTAFNGRSAIVQGWDQSTSRYNILVVAADAPGGCQQAKIKRENLRLALCYP